MRFLYLSRCSLLENIFAHWHLALVIRHRCGFLQLKLIYRKVTLPECADGLIGRNGSIQMLDVLMIAMAAGFFALAIGYAYACERL